MNAKSTVFCWASTAAFCVAAMAAGTGCHQPEKWSYTGPRVYLIEGAANEQLIEVIAAELNVKRSQVKVIRGQSSKRKVVEISGVEDIHEGDPS